MNYEPIDSSEFDGPWWKEALHIIFLFITCVGGLVILAIAFAR